MKRFGLCLAMVIMSSLPAVLMFGHAAAGPADTPYKNGPTARSTKLATKNGPSASRSTNPPKPVVKPSTPLPNTSGLKPPNPKANTSGSKPGGFGPGKANFGALESPNPNTIQCKRCPSPVVSPVKPPHKKGGK